jgi:IS30 family transposase
MSYRQLTLDERYQVQTLHALGFAQVDIGRTLGRHASTISRELRRNVRVAARYDASAAQAAARRRRVAKGERSRRIQGWLKELVERKLRLAWSPEQISGRVRLEKRMKVDTQHVAPATIEALDTDVVDAVESITNDNGAEFQGDAKLQKTMGVPIYFTDPSSPWQRGSIENLNGLIRQYVPKGADIDKLPAWTAEALENSLNFRPRKTLGYRSPHEVHFRQRLALIANQRMHFGLEFSAAI